MSVIAANLEVPWGIAFLPGGDALFTERDSGRLLRMDSAENIEEVQTLPTRGYGEGGSLGLAVSPNYREDGYVYAYYTTNIDNRVVRFRLGEEPHPILTGIPFKTPTTTAAGSPSARTACSTSPRATPATPPTPRTVAL